MAGSRGQGLSWAGAGGHTGLIWWGIKVQVSKGSWKRLYGGFRLFQVFRKTSVDGFWKSRPQIQSEGMPCPGPTNQISYQSSPQSQGKEERGSKGFNSPEKRAAGPLLNTPGTCNSVHQNMAGCPGPCIPMAYNLRECFKQKWLHLWGELPCKTLMWTHSSIMRGMR